uniref:Peptidase A2 domain-containing protein n=1 Tax=Trichogramma kaykai TaxID=54128 RepID=A0ABD2XQJ8_9HYME
MLIDSGADISVIPRELVEAATESSLKLYAADASPLKTFGAHDLTLKFNQPEPFVHTFVATHVPYPILGADFICDYQLLIDLPDKRLLRRDGTVFASGDCIRSPNLSLSLLAPDQKYRDLLLRFPTLCDAKHRKPLEESMVCHMIITTGRPVSEPCRKLGPEKLKAAQEFFQNLIDQDLTQRSSSERASPINLVEKKDGSWRVFGDYRKLNSITVPDKYPVKRFQDFSTILFNATVCSTLDLEKAFLQIPLRTEHRPKTALITPFGLYEFKLMTFGMGNAAQTFQRYADSMLGDLPFVYVLL